jgi:linoleoyl-CoA desaturase
LYALLYIQWISYTDYRKYFTGKVGNVPIKPLTLLEHISFWSFKVLHLLIFIVMPILFVGFVPFLVGFLIYSSFTGILLAVVFQLAHVVEETSFLQAPPAPDTLNLEDEFMVHQLRTTANFATRSKLLRWWLGGLNYQVEHHLFPNISHVHYPAISGIVKQVCLEFKMPYHEHRYFVGALWSHMKHLRSLGMA